MSKAIVVLTRGYDDIKKYDRLILRNRNIVRCLGDLSMDIVIFHEGNIPESHQQHIKSQTPRLNIKFINVAGTGKAFINKSYVKAKRDSDTMGIYDGYFHMCSFWFVNFWHFVENYDYILRVDEDCIINFKILEMFRTLETKVACYGTWVRDDPRFVKGLYQFNLAFLQKHNITPKGRINDNYIDDYGFWTSKVSGPYTNLLGLNLSKLRNNESLKKYIETVKLSDYIYIRRWGDLPLWGSALECFYSNDEHVKLRSMRYVHDNMKLNM